MTWDGSKGGRILENKKKKKDETKSFLKKRIGKVGGTCSRKPQTLFWYSTNFKCCFGIFFNKTWDYAII